MARPKRTVKEIIISLLVVFLAATVSASFFTFIAIRNTVSPERTETTSGKIEAITTHIKPARLCIQLEDGREFWIPRGFSKLLSKTEYDAEMLREILTDKTVEIEYLEHSTTYHIINIKVDGIELDFLACVNDYNIAVHFGVLVLMLVSFLLIWEIWYYSFLVPEKNKKFPDYH